MYYTYKQDKEYSCKDLSSHIFMVGLPQTSCNTELLPFGLRYSAGAELITNTPLRLQILQVTCLYLRYLYHALNVSLDVRPSCVRRLICSKILHFLFSYEHDFEYIPILISLILCTEYRSKDEDVKWALGLFKNHGKALWHHLILTRKHPEL